MTLRIIILRHGVAESRKLFAHSGKPDALRPLTPRGRKKMRRNIKGLLALSSEIDVVVSSPCVRAKQTADLLREKLPHAKLVELPALEPNREAIRVLDWLKSERFSRSSDQSKTVCLVGHEPGLSDLASECLVGSKSSAFSLKKGGACIIEFSSEPRKGKAKLICLIQPSELRRIGETGKSPT